MTKSKRNALILRGLVFLGAGFTGIVFLGLVAYILIRGIPNLNWGLFAWEYNTNNASMMPASNALIAFNASRERRGTAFGLNKPRVAQKCVQPGLAKCRVLPASSWISTPSPAMNAPIFVILRPPQARVSAAAFAGGTASSNS